MAKKLYINQKSNSQKNAVFIECWDVAELEAFFRPIEDCSMRLDECTEIYSVKTFVERHLEYVKANNGNPLFKPYYDRLTDLKQLLENKGY
jgi:hypothetical protein